MQLTFLELDMGDPFYDQLTGVKSRYPLTSTTLLYRGLRLELIEITRFLKSTAVLFFMFAGSSIIWTFHFGLYEAPV